MNMFTIRWFMQVKKEEIKLKILDIATKEFLQNGFLKASIRKIARECNISPGNLYHYFVNKEDLYINIALKFNQERVEFIYKRMRTGKSAFEKLRNYCVAYFEYARNNLDIFRLSMYYILNGLNENSFSEETKNYMSEMLSSNSAEFRKIVEDGIKSGEFSSEINISEFLTAFTMSVRIALNEVVLLKYKDEQFYLNYIDFLFKGLLKRNEV